jgi:hypothetical protein
VENRFSPKSPSCLDENYFCISQTLTKKSPVAQKDTAEPSKKRHQIIRAQYKKHINP